MTFKVGDRVLVISEEYGEAQFGKTGIVDEVNRPGDLDVQIEYDTPLNGHGMKKNQYRSEHLELIASVGPVRTETVRRIEPGVYGRLSVAEDTAPYVSIALTSPDGTEVIERYRRSFSAPELRELARVALEIAGYLDAQ